MITVESKTASSSSNNTSGKSFTQDVNLVYNRWTENVDEILCRGALLKWSPVDHFGQPIMVSQTILDDTNSPPGPILSSKMVRDQL